MKNLLFYASFAFIFLNCLNADSLRALLITGEGYHDYENQKNILKDGLSERMDIKIDIQHDKSAEEMKERFSKANWQKDYDLVIYNICHAKETDKTFVDSLTKMHHDGLPAIAIHCTMHSYHWRIDGDKSWVKMLGVTSPNHGPKSKIKIDVLDKNHPIMKGLPDSWTTPQGELYNIKEVHGNTKVLAEGTRTEAGDKTPQPCIWVNQYGKARIFGTTIGHHNETMQQKEYMDFLVNAVKWVTEKSPVKSNDYVSLFDGKSLDGWNGNPDFWSVQDGALTGITTKDKPTVGNTFLIYTGDNSDKQAKEFDDFELKLKFRIFEHNSGIQYRSFLAEGQHDGWRVGGYQSDIDADNNWSGTNYGERFRGILAKRGEKAVIKGTEVQTQKNGKKKEICLRDVTSIGDAEELKKHIKAAPEWNEMHIIAKGHHLIQKINGVVMSEVIDNDVKNRRDSGLIAIQLHAGPPMKIQVKDIKIK